MATFRDLALRQAKQIHRSLATLFIGIPLLWFFFSGGIIAIFRDWPIEYGQGTSASLYRFFQTWHSFQPLFSKWNGFYVLVNVAFATAMLVEVITGLYWTLTTKEAKPKKRTPIFKLRIFHRRMAWLLAASLGIISFSGFINSIFKTFPVLLTYSKIVHNGSWLRFNWIGLDTVFIHSICNVTSGLLGIFVIVSGIRLSRRKPPKNKGDRSKEKTKTLTTIK